MRINIHIPEVLNEQIREMATDDARSVSNMIAVLVTEAIKAREEDNR